MAATHGRHVDNEHSCPSTRRFERRGQTGDTRADNQHIGLSPDLRDMGWSRERQHRREHRHGNHDWDDRMWTKCREHVATIQMAANTAL